MNVSAKDKAGGSENTITITNDKGRLSESDIERMVAEAEQYAAEDNADKEPIEKAVAETTAWLDAHEGASTAEIETKKKELENVCNPIMMKLYGQSGSGIPSDEPSADGGAGPTIDEVD